MRNVLWVGLGLFFGLTGGAAADEVALKDSVPHIEVTGHAQVDVVPDEAFLWIGVTTERPSAAEASAETARVSSAMRDATVAQGIAAREIKTSSASIVTVDDEERDPSGRTIKRTLRGYQSNIEFKIHVSDVGKVGALAQTLIELGANRFDGIQFHSTRERETRRTLQGDAMKDALAETQGYTNAIGLKLGRVLQIGDSAGQQDGQADLPVRDALVGKTIASTLIPIEPGVQTMSSDIRVIWEIEPHVTQP